MVSNVSFGIRHSSSSHALISESELLSLLELSDDEESSGPAEAGRFSPRGLSTLTRAPPPSPLTESSSDFRLELAVPDPDGPDGDPLTTGGLGAACGGADGIE